jgi:hypothetical protein
MILGYSHRNSISPKVGPEHIAKFQQLAMQQNPGLANEMKHYHNVGGQIASRIEGLDQDRRRMAHDDLNQNLLSHVQSGLASGQTAPAVAAIRAHLQKLAQQHGVPLPMQAPTAAPAAPGPARM